MKRIYGAYGSNLNIKQMKKRCPTAKVIGTTVINNYALVFRGTGDAAVATLEPSPGSGVPIALWEIQVQDEYHLDRYEGYPDLYRKEILDFNVSSQVKEIMMYLMNEQYPYEIPSSQYIDVIKEGYHDHGFDERILLDAVEQAKENVQRLENDELSQQLVE